jgi:hypothetical protein
LTRIAKREKKPFSIRLEEHDRDFLKSVDAAKFVHEAIVEQERKDRATGKVTPLAHEIVADLAEAYVTWFEDTTPDEQEQWDNYMGNCLFEISKLTLRAALSIDQRIKRYAPWRWDQINNLTKLRESKEFMERIKEKCGESKLNEEWLPGEISEDDLETIRQVFTEARILLERRYRKLFRKRPPSGWCGYYSLRRSSVVEQIPFDDP